jgi:hypothetical protein
MNTEYENMCPMDMVMCYMIDSNVHTMIFSANQVFFTKKKIKPSIFHQKKMNMVTIILRNGLKNK